MKLKNSSLLVFLLLPMLLSAQEYADCARAMEICKKTVYHFDKVRGEGDDRTEAEFVPCFLNGTNPGMAERNSAWIKFRVEEAGTLTFVITPHRFDNDLDFVVYRLGSDGSCRNKQIVRCMAAGDPAEAAIYSPCLGETGLRSGERATSRDAGCSDENDNAWLAPLNVKKNEYYVILVSNVSMPGPGFSIRFGGSAKLPCDDEKPKVEKEKPPVVQPKPKPQPEPIAEVPKPNPKPEKIANRPIAVGKKLTVSSRKLTLKISDSQVEDGDVCSIYLDDKKLYSNIYLTLKPKTFEIELPADQQEHYLTIHAEDFGKAAVNTAKIEIFDGEIIHAFNLTATPDSQECVKLTVK